MKIHCKYTGVKGNMTVYRDALRYRYMIQPQALRKAKILVFAEKHGRDMALEAFDVKRRTFFAWKKKWIAGRKTPEALNGKSKAPKTKRRRLWSEEAVAEIKRLRWEHPNLGKEKLYPELQRFCTAKNLLFRISNNEHKQPGGDFNLLC